MTALDMGELCITPTFLGIPSELRMLVYDVLLGDRAFWFVFPGDQSCQSGILGSLAVLSVSRTVYEEARRALRVRTLRINKFREPEYKLLSKIPYRSAKHARTIENLFVGYLPGQFDTMTKRTEHNSERTMLLENLQNVIRGLPRLTSVTITCDDARYQQSQDLEGRVTILAAELRCVMRDFDHITATIKEVPVRSGRDWHAQIRFLRYTDKGESWVGRKSFRQISTDS